MSVVPCPIRFTQMLRSPGAAGNQRLYSLRSSLAGDACCAGLEDRGNNRVVLRGEPEPTGPMARRGHLRSACGTREGPRVTAASLSGSCRAGARAGWHSALLFLRPAVCGEPAADMAARQRGAMCISRSDGRCGRWRSHCRRAPDRVPPPIERFADDSRAYQRVVGDAPPRSAHARGAPARPLVT